MNHFLQFKRDRFYLIKYLASHLFLICVMLWFQLKNVGSFKLSFEIWQLALIPLGLILGIQIPVLIHNCVHRNLKPRWLNFLVGELAGLYVLLSMASFEINHIMHHAHADSDLDPHNPYERNFIKFFFANNFGGTEMVLEKYLQFHGDTNVNRLNFSLMVFLHFINVPLRILFWILLLGPSLFILVFIPSYVFHMFVFAHINFKTHETFEDGRSEVYNLDSNLYYKIVNFFGSGVYYHKNHHQNPGLYNPKNGPAHSWLFR